MKTISSIFDDSPEARAKREAERAHQKRLLEGRQTAIKFLGLAKKPSGKVARKLSEAGFSSSEIAQIIESLTKDNYLDDETVARKLIRQRTGRKSEAVQALRIRMQQQGLSNEVIDLVLADIRSDMDSALDLLRTRFQNTLTGWPFENRQEQQKQRLKIIRFLAGRGFSPDLVNRALSIYFQTDDDND